MAHASVRHLRAHGAYLHKRSTEQHLILVSAKGEVVDTPYDRVAEAFGVENHPHLLHALKEGDDQLKCRVLEAMATLFRLPQDLVMCLKLGVLELVERGLEQNDSELCELSARVLSVMVESPCGQAAILRAESAKRLLSVLSSETTPPRTQCLLYDTLIGVSRCFAGGRQLAEVGYLPVVLGHLAPRVGGRPPAPDKDAPPPRLDGEDDRARRVRALQLLKNLVNDGVDFTAFRALDLDAVAVCTRHLRSPDFATRSAACDALGTLAFVDKARKAAVEHGAVPRLGALLSDSHWQVAAASAGALMIVAVHDEAKRQLMAADALANVNHLLQSPHYLVQLNTVKLVAVMAAYPPARRVLGVSSTEYHLRLLMQPSSDALLAKSAKTALLSVHWQA